MMSPFYNLHVNLGKKNCFGPGSPIGKLSDNKSVRCQDDPNLSHNLITVAKIKPDVLLLGGQPY